MPNTARLGLAAALCAAVAIVLLAAGVVHGSDALQAIGVLAGLIGVAMGRVWSARRFVPTEPEAGARFERAESDRSEVMAIHDALVPVLDRTVERVAIRLDPHRSRRGDRSAGPRSHAFPRAR
jgi:hypothetical protein